MAIVIMLAPLIAHIFRVIYLIQNGRMNYIGGWLFVLLMIVVVILSGFVAILSSL